MRTVRIAAAASALALIGLLLLSPARGLSAPDEYVVRVGDTLSEIAERQGVTVEELAEANGIVDADLILSGQVLLIPRQDAPPAMRASQSSGGAEYVVHAGDTLSEIAERFGVPMAALVEANGLLDPHFITEGETLAIPHVESPLVPPVSPGIESIIEGFAREEGLDAGLVKALAYLESGWQQHVVSSAGAAGVMQIHPSTGYWLEREVFGYDLNLETSAHDNVKAGVRYLRILMDLTGDPDRAVAAYYQGYGALSMGILYEDTIQYLADVKAIRERFWP